MLYVLIIITTITRFGTIGGAGVAIDHIEFHTAAACAAAADAVKDLKGDTRAICVANPAKDQ